jgi:hypothetical protein
MFEGSLIHYTTEYSGAQIKLRGLDGTSWLTQRQLTDLFENGVRTVNGHIQTVFPGGSAREFRRGVHASTHRKADWLLTAQTEGLAKVERSAKASKKPKMGGGDA